LGLDRRNNATNRLLALGTGSRRRHLKLFGNAQAANDKLVNLQLADPGMTDCQSTDG
jgi:hypothetical protein